MRRLILLVVLAVGLSASGTLQANNLPLPIPNRVGPFMDPDGFYPSGPCIGLENVGVGPFADPGGFYPVILGMDFEYVGLGPMADPGGFYPAGGPIMGTCGSVGTVCIGPLVEPNGSAGCGRIGPHVEPHG